MLIGRNARKRAYIKPPFKGCVVVQGPTYSQWITKVKESWAGYQIIFSTWEGQADKSLYDETDIVIYNPMPACAGVKNLNLQKVSTINGFLKAKELGWKRALKVRGDFSTTSADGLFGLFDKTKLNLHGYWRSGYISDFFMEGEIDDVITLFETDNIDGEYPEWHLTKKLYESGLNKKSVCIVKKMSKGVADIYWEKLSYWFSQHTNNEDVTNVLPEKWRK
jgi:hypothetical protein